MIDDPDPYISLSAGGVHTLSTVSYFLEGDSGYTC